MRINFCTLLFFKLFLLLNIVPQALFAQIKIVSPTPRAVYQRDAKGEREVIISGTFDIPIDKIEARAVPVIAGQGIDTPWKDLNPGGPAPKGGVFSGSIVLYGGWYTVEVRASKGGNIVARDVLERLGVGEVFIIAGQSNAQGLKAFPGAPEAEDDRVIYISNNINDTKDLLTDPPRPEFSKVGKVDYMAPRGQTSWCWGALGDLLVKRLGVPVLFINTAWEGTAVENWWLSSQGLTTSSYYSRDYIYPPRMPYANLRIAAQNYGSQYGVRAILWMQGEADTFAGTPANNYRENMQNLMNKLGSDFGARVTWVIARTSRTSPSGNDLTPLYSANVIAAQNAVIDTKFNATFPGPETDKLVVNRGDGTHFVGQSVNDIAGTRAALITLANGWNESLSNEFFTTVPPVGPAVVPALSASCVQENNAVSISLPEGFNSYTWNNGQTGRTIRVTQPGTYFAVVKNQQGNSIITSSVVLTAGAKPAVPTILPQGAQQACAEEGIVFSVVGQDSYNWYKEGSETAIFDGKSVTAKEQGNYTVRAENIFGCVSDKSASSSLTIRPKTPKPVIESSGPFSITATIPQDMTEKYTWKRPGIDKDTIADIIKVLKTGTYSVRAQVTYNLGANQLTCYSDSTSKNYIALENNDVVFYPNPSTLDFIYVESRDDIKNAEITVYDIFGRILVTQSISVLNSRVPFRIKNLASGKYIVRITGEGTSITKQIVVR